MKAFFDHMRNSFGGSFTEAQVQGMDALLYAGRNLPLHHMANVLAQVRRETGGHMSPIKETVMPSHKDKNPTDREVIARLDRAFKAGKLPWVKTPYWRDGYFGRGQIQVTHKDNYAKFGIAVTPEKALDLDTSAYIAVEGMSKGMFTGKKLSDYNFPGDLNQPPAHNPRRIVNGKDGSDAEVARFHREFASALEAAHWGKPLTPKPVADSPAPDTGSKPGWLAAFIAALVAMFRGRQ
jgi:predicted chitinase